MRERGHAPWHGCRSFPSVVWPHLPLSPPFHFFFSTASANPTLPPRQRSSSVSSSIDVNPYVGTLLRFLAAPLSFLTRALPSTTRPSVARATPRGGASPSRLADQYRPEDALAPAAAASSTSSADPLTLSPGWADAAQHGAQRTRPLPLDPEFGDRSWDADGRLSPEVQRRRDYARMALGPAPARPPRDANQSPVTRDQPIVIDDSDDDDDDNDKDDGQAGAEDSSDPYSSDTTSGQRSSAHTAGAAIQIIDSDSDDSSGEAGKAKGRTEKDKAPAPVRRTLGKGKADSQARRPSVSVSLSRSRSLAPRDKRRPFSSSCRRPILFLLGMFRESVVWQRRPDSGEAAEERLRRPRRASAAAASTHAFALFSGSPP